MRNQAINKSKMYVLNYRGVEDVLDENNNKTGEKVISYTRPIAFKSHQSSAKGSSQVEMFGLDISYDIVILLTKAECERLKIKETSVFFVDKKPQYDGNTPLYDYRVKKIAKTINEVAIALERVQA